jgi:hypothetical protein
MSTSGRGVYGFRLEGVEAAYPLLVPTPRDWPLLRLRARLGFDSATSDSLDSDHCQLRLRSGGVAQVDWPSGNVLFTLRRRTAPADLIHPNLLPVAALGSRRSGRESFRAGAVVLGGGAWAVIGARGAGKSSLLAWLALGGYSVLTDDLLVVDERRRALAGPRMIDLREAAAQRLGVGEPVADGHEERYRMLVGGVLPAVPLRGFIRLAWGYVPTVVKVPPAWRPAALASSRAVRLSPRDPGVLAALSALPMVELRRPRDWGATADAADRLLGALAG